MDIKAFFTSHPKHNEERLKLAAGGCHLIAIAVVGTALIAPLFNPAMSAPYSRIIGAAVVAAILEVVAMKLLGYLPLPDAPAATQETRNG